MLVRPPTSTPLYSAAASDVYQIQGRQRRPRKRRRAQGVGPSADLGGVQAGVNAGACWGGRQRVWTVSYTHLRAQETSQDLVCRLLQATRNTLGHHVQCAQLSHRHNETADICTTVTKNTT